MLLVLEPGDFDRFREPSASATVATAPGQHGGRLIYRPLEALRALARFQPSTRRPVLTGTPGGTALTAPPRVVEVIGSMLPAATKWKAFFNRQAGNRMYFQDGDVVEATIATPTACARSAGRPTR